MFPNLFTSRRSAAARTTRRCGSERLDSRRLRVESLESRVLLDAAPVFDSVVGIAAAVAPYASKVDAAGNTYLAGTLWDTSDFDPNQVRADGSDILTPRGSEDAFVAKYAPDNSLIWARRMGGDFLWGSVYGANDPQDAGTALAIDGAGNAYVTGNFVGQADFGSFTLTGSGSSDAFLAKLDPNGNFVWANRWGAATRDFGEGIAVDTGGNVVAVGATATVSSTGGYSLKTVEMRKYSPTGASVWTKQISGWGNATAGVATDAAGNIYVSGHFTGTVDFNPDPKKTNYVVGSASALSNGYVLKLTAAGNFGWVSPFIAKSSPGHVNIHDVAIDNTGNIVVGGYYFGSIDFNPSAQVDFRLPSTSVNDGFVAKLSPTGALGWATPLAGGPIQSIAIDSTGVYATGRFSGTFSPGFGLPDVAGNGVAHTFVSHFTNAGAVDWALTNGGTGAAPSYSIALDGNGTIYVTGNFSAYNGKVVDFDPDPVGTYELTTPTSTSQMFLLKLRKQSAAALNDAALASLTLADTQRSTPSGKKTSVFDSEMDWLAVSQL